MTIQPCFIIPFTVLCQKCMLASCKADKKNITISLTYSYLFSTLQFVVYKTLPTININYLCLKICLNYKLWNTSCQYIFSGCFLLLMSSAIFPAKISKITVSVMPMMKNSTIVVPTASPAALGLFSPICWQHPQIARLPVSLRRRRLPAAQGTPALAGQILQLSQR